MIQHQPPALSIRDASLAYGELLALRGLTLDLYPGEILGLLGPNGAGKTSLIRCIAGRQQLSSGSIECAFDGNTMDGIGVVPQEIAIYRDLTVEQNLSAFGSLQGIAGRALKERINAALDWADLEPRRRAMAGLLSGGMQRRLNIACSVLHQPQILLLDEPTVGVDPQSRERIYAMLDKLVQSGTAILLTTHHLEEAQERCDRMAIIDRGRVLEVGTLKELLARTIGTRQQIQFRFSAPPGPLPLPLQPGESSLDALGYLSDARTELPRLLFALHQRSATIEHMTLREPTLQHLFLHLTGKELRE